MERRTHVRGWMVPLLLLGTLDYAIAEEITLTTYYPSPRGVYNELRTAGNVQIGSIEAPVDATTAPRLHVVLRKDTDPATAAPALLIEDEVDTSLAAPRDQSPFVIDSAGNVGIGTTGDPSTGLSAKLEVAGQVRFDNGGLCLGNDCRTQWPEVRVIQGTNPTCAPAREIFRNWLAAGAFTVGCGQQPSQSCAVTGGFGVGLPPPLGNYNCGWPGAPTLPCAPNWTDDKLDEVLASGGGWSWVLCQTQQ